MRPLCILGLACGLAGCATRLEPESRWSDELKGEPLSHVLLRKDVGIISEGFGSGLVLHSSKERGTILLTCAHLACYTPEMLVSGSGEDFQSAVGREHTCGRDVQLDVFIHANSVSGEAPWSEWRKFRGDVLYGRFVIEGFPIDSRYRADSISDFKSPRMLDLALVRVHTGREPLHPISLTPGHPTFPAKGTVAGIDYISNRPYRSAVLLPSEGVFLKDGQYSSGSGVFDREGRFCGVFAMEVPFSGWVSTGEERIEISRQYCYVPFQKVRKVLTEEGFAWLFGREDAVSEIR